MKFDCELKQKSFELGQAYYKKHSDYPKTTVTAAFLQGVIFEERQNRCSFHDRSWYRSQNCKSI